MKKHIAIMALAMAFAACGKVETDIQPVDRQSAEAGAPITLTATLAPKTGGAKALADYDDGKITATWAVLEQIAILYELGGVKKRATATVISVDTDTGAASIAFSVEAGTTDGTSCTLVYPADAAKDDNTGVKDSSTLLAVQNGTLRPKGLWGLLRRPVLDVRVGEGTLHPGTPADGLKVTTQPQPQFAIFKFTLRKADGTTAIRTRSLTITIGSDICTITPATATDVLYAALPAVTGQKVSFDATDDGNKTYLFTAPGVTFSKGQYYQSTLKLREYVDMGEVTINGVIKNLKWATCNVGAENPWNYGDYYAWGETTTKTDYDWSTYKWCNGDWFKITKYCTESANWDSSDPMDNKTVLDPEDDVAHVKWGGTWRIPTDEEWTALRNTTYYTWTWTNDYLNDGSNHKGRIVTRKAGTGPCSGKSIFLPAAGIWTWNRPLDNGPSGHYWSSSLYTDGYPVTYPCNAWRVYFNNSDDVVRDADNRRFGHSVRPVTE